MNNQYYSKDNYEPTSKASSKRSGMGDCGWTYLLGNEMSGFIWTVMIVFIIEATGKLCRLAYRIPKESSRSADAIDAFLLICFAAWAIYLLVHA